jgi:3-deoxy-D-manno-octulosonic-acid transferase
VTGSIKFDPDVHTKSHTVAASVPDALLVGASESLVLFGGSTHPGEEEILARVFLHLRQRFPSLRLFIAPRHVERLREVRAQLTALGMRIALASQTRSDGCNDADCVLLDTTGELQRWYDVATVVFVGKSLSAHGGQNPVEAILAGKPVVFGPHMENFAKLAKALVAENGALEVRDADSLQRAIAELLSDSAACTRLVQNARAVLSTHQGATARAAALVHELKSKQ